MSDFKAKINEIRFFSPQTRPRELTALPQTRSWIQGDIILWEEKGGKGKGRN